MKYLITLILSQIILSYCGSAKEAKRVKLEDIEHDNLISEQKTKDSLDSQQTQYFIPVSYTYNGYHQHENGEHNIKYVTMSPESKQPLQQSIQHVQSEQKNPYLVNEADESYAIPLTNSERGPISYLSKQPEYVYLHSDAPRTSNNVIYNQIDYFPSQPSLEHLKPPGITQLTNTNYENLQLQPIKSSYILRNPSISYQLEKYAQQYKNSSPLPPVTISSSHTNVIQKPIIQYPYSTNNPQQYTKYYATVQPTISNELQFHSPTSESTHPLLAPITLSKYYPLVNYQEQQQQQSSYLEGNRYPPKYFDLFGHGNNRHQTSLLSSYIPSSIILSKQHLFNAH